MSAVILALAGGVLIGACARTLDARTSRVARARLALTSALAGILVCALALHLGWGGA